MFARRDFLYKRSHWNRANPFPHVQPSPPGSDSASASSAAAASEPITAIGPVVPASTEPATSAASPSPDTPSLATPSTSLHSSSAPFSLSSSSSPSASTPTPSISTSSSPTPTISSIVSTPLTLATSTPHATSVATRVAASTSFTLTSTPSPSTTSTRSSSASNTGAIVGGVAGTLAGIAFLGFFIMWCMRRQRDRDVDDFDAKAFKRQSAILVDDPAEPPRSYNPRPPTMFEHHNASPALAAQAGHGGQNFYDNYGGYGQQPPAAPEMVQHVGPLPPQAYGSPPMGYASYNDLQQQISGQPMNVGQTGYDSQQQLARQPSNAAYLTRQASSAVGYAPPTAPPSSFDPNPHYVDLSRSSVSPYQAGQYAEISRQLGTNDPNGQHPNESELLDGPLPSPFDDPVGATSVPPPTSHIHPDSPSDVAAPGSVPATAGPQTQGKITEAHQRPPTVYDDGDAYGGI